MLCVGKRRNVLQTCYNHLIVGSYLHFSSQTTPKAFSRNDGSPGFKTKPRLREEEINFKRLRKYRLNRIRNELTKKDIGAALFFDPVNIRYALDITNMSIYSFHNFGRYCFIPESGPVILFEFHNCEHLAKHMELIDEIRPGVSWEYTVTGHHTKEKVSSMANEIKALMKETCGENKRLAVDSCDAASYWAFKQLGIDVQDGKRLTEHARLIKNEDEITCMEASIEVAEIALEEIQKQLHVGITEEELWSHLHKINIENGGEWIETRLLNSGVRTNPWFAECSNKVIEENDLVGLDTDMVGVYGYCADISRTFVEGGKFSSNQKKLYEKARHQLEYNMSLIKPGVSMTEFTEKSFPLESKYIGNRYSCLIHGVGLCDEYPFVNYAIDGGMLDDCFQENMTICVESYIGETGGKEGVKLEQQCLVSKDGLKLLSKHPLEEF